MSLVSLNLQLFDSSFLDPVCDSPSSTDADPEFDAPSPGDSIQHLVGIRGGIQLAINSYIYIHCRAVKMKDSDEIVKR